MEEMEEEEEIEEVYEMEIEEMEEVEEMEEPTARRTNCKSWSPSSATLLQTAITTPSADHSFQPQGHRPIGNLLDQENTGHQKPHSELLLRRIHTRRKDSGKEQCPPSQRDTTLN